MLEALPLKTIAYEKESQEGSLALKKLEIIKRSKWQFII